MIDYEARSQLAQAARGLITGRITNDQFELRQPQSSDVAVQEIFYRGFHPLYSDTSEHRLIGKRRLGPENRLFGARCIVFLKSDLPYGWPVQSLFASIRPRFRNLFTLGRANREYEQHLATFGDVTLWPFQSATQYAAALRSPVYLTGMGSNNSFKPNLSASAAKSA